MTKTNSTSQGGSLATPAATAALKRSHGSTATSRAATPAQSVPDPRLEEEQRGKEEPEWAKRALHRAIRQLDCSEIKPRRA